LPSSKLRSIFLLPFLLLITLAATGPDPKADPAKAARLNNLGVALMNQQRMDKAVEKFNEALAADASLATAELNKGIALLNQQKLPEAEEALKRAAALTPDDPGVWYNFGLLYRSEGKNEEGIEAFRKVLQLDPRDPDAHYFVASLLLQQQQYDQAIVEFKQALSIQPLHASAEFGLARALQRSGRIEEAREHLKIFERFTKEKISTPMTLAYGEQGKYSVAQDVVTNEPKVGPMIPVTFAPQSIGTASSSASSTKAEGFRGGACLLDADGDGRGDIVLMRQGDQALQVFANEGAGRFKEISAAQLGLALKGSGISCAVGDFDNDERPDLAIALEDRVVLFKNSAKAKFVDMTKDVGITSTNKPTGLTFIDYDHDGDLDLFVTGSALDKSTPNTLWRNNGNGTFANWTEQASVGGDKNSVSAVLSDANNDRAVDLLVTGAGTSPTFFANLREGKFKASSIYESSLSPTIGIATVDFNKDGWMDVLLTHSEAPGVSLWKNVDGKRFEQVSLPISDAKRAWGITSIDFDNDGWIDLAAVVETPKGTELKLLRNMGPAGFTDVSESAAADKIPLKNARALIGADLDGDGDSDLLVSQADGTATFLRNDGGNKNRSLRISLVGLGDNKSGLGTKIEVFADGLWQKWEMTGASGYLSQGATEILAGLGSRQQVDIVRMLWPTGVLQDETEVALDKPAIYTELDRRGSSCPTLFAWDGTKYQFISDVIGAAVVGHWVSPTERNVADPDEWIKIDGSKLSPKNGNFSLRFGEPMEEVNYVDQVRLVAIDHPKGIEVFPNERFLSAPPFPQEKTIVTSSPKLPLGAWDDRGNEVLDLLRYPDHKYVKDFTNLKFVGYSNMHALTLDLGKWSTTSPLRLYLHGFIEYFTATSMYAAWQAGINPVAPFVEAQLPDGTWKRVVDDMGFPAGLPRTIVVDLTNKLPQRTRKIRISTNLQIYWDQVLVDNGPERRTFRKTELPLTSADLDFRGYPKQIDGETPGDLTYHYEEVSQTGPFSRQRGTYTRLGEVKELLQTVDDKFVIFGSGEDIDLQFSTSSLPPLPKGWKRDYFFFANGWVKDMDFYEATPFTVADLPFRKMSGYPYPATERYPDHPELLEYRLNWNDRFDSGNQNAEGYGFRYQKRQQ
jgi:tetratricopeptide (TPR) repeat protein